jgi:hypothetical protein
MRRHKKRVLPPKSPPLCWQERQVSREELEAWPGISEGERRFTLQVLTHCPTVTLWDTPQGLMFKGIRLKTPAEMAAGKRGGP